MNLIYMCVFHQKSYINLLKLLIRSISIKGNINRDTTNILIITSPLFENIIKKEFKNIDLPLHYYILDIHSLFGSACARLNIFNYDNIHKYANILYLDTDVLINSDINVLFNLELSSDKLYALKEGNIGHDFWGGELFNFEEYNRQLDAFTSGILLFKNSNSIKSLFNMIKKHIKIDIYEKNKKIPYCLDQPYIVYNAITENKYDNELLCKYVENNPSVVTLEKIIYHFPGGPGAYDSKFFKMNHFWNKMLDVDFVLENKKYSWQNSSIIFLKNGIMNAFGKGIYTHDDSHIVEATFGGRIHTLVFNNDYTEFISTRKDDGEVVKGKLV